MLKIVVTAVLTSLLTSLLVSGICGCYYTEPFVVDEIVDQTPESKEVIYPTQYDCTL